MLPRPRCPPLFPYTTLFRSGQARGAPGLEVWPASGRDEKPVTRHDRAGLEVQHDVGGLLLDRHARIADEDLDPVGDRKSTRLNSSHRCISYAVFCLKKKNK